MKTLSEKIQRWNNPATTEDERRGLLKSIMAVNFIKQRRLARQYHSAQANEQLEKIGRYVVHTVDILQMHFSDHEFAQLIGANYKRIEKLRQDNDDQGYETPFFIAVILKGPEQDLDQPLVSAILQTLKREFEDDPSLREKARDKLEDIMPELRGMYYTITVDEEGNETNEKYYPPLKLVKS